MPANTAETLEVLAKIKDPAKRHDVAMGVVDLCLAQPLAPAAEPIAGELLVTLSSKSDDETKAQIAARLAPCNWAPHDIIRFLAFEPIEISAVIIENSPRLTQKDMIELAKKGTTDHRRVLAMRANLCLAVTDTLAEPARPSCCAPWPTTPPPKSANTRWTSA